MEWSNRYRAQHWHFAQTLQLILLNTYTINVGATDTRRETSSRVRMSKQGNQPNYLVVDALSVPNFSQLGVTSSTITNGSFTNLNSPAGSNINQLAPSPGFAFQWNFVLAPGAASSLGASANLDSVPEPGTLIMLAAGLGVIGRRRRLARKAVG